MVHPKPAARGGAPAANDVPPRADTTRREERRGAGAAGWSAARLTVYGMRLAAGPLVLAGFFLPWAEGTGVLAASEFTGFRLLSLAERLEQLDLSPFQSGELWLVRAVLLGVVIAAAWHTALAPAHRWHRFYALSGWYLVLVFAGALLLALVRSGLVLPPLGLALCAGGAFLFATSELVTRRFTSASIDEEA